MAKGGIDLGKETHKNVTVITTNNLPACIPSVAPSLILFLRLPSSSWFRSLVCYNIRATVKPRDCRRNCIAVQKKKKHRNIAIIVCLKFIPNVKLSTKERWFDPFRWELTYLLASFLPSDITQLFRTPVGCPVVWKIVSANSVYNAKLKSTQWTNVRRGGTKYRWDSTQPGRQKMRQKDKMSSADYF